MNDRGDLRWSSTHPGEPDFLRRVLIVVAVTSAAVAAFLLLWQAAGVLVLLFAGVLLGVALRGAGDAVARLTRLPGGWALSLVLVVLAALLGAAGWFLGSEIAGQFEELSRSLASSGQRLQDDLEKYRWWPDSLELPSAREVLSRRSNVFEQITGAFSAALGAVANLVVVLFVGVFVAAQPVRYRAGVLHLVPLEHRPRAGQVLDAVGSAMRRWVAGRLLDMSAVAVLTGIGLYLLGTPVPLALALLTGLIVFIPYLGPVLSAVPAVLIALSQGPNAALYVALLYLGIQTAESYLLQPLIQERAVDLPPAVVIGAQLLLGVLLGVLGVMFATPLVAAVVVAVKMLYVRAALGDPVEVKGAPPPEAQEVR